MTYEKLKQIIQDSGKDNWLHDDSKGVFTYKEDLNVTIRRERFDDSELADEGNAIRGRVHAVVRHRSAQRQCA